jgi:hypothetical protein
MCNLLVSLIGIASKLRLNLILGDQLIAKRRNEKFKRIKCSTLAKLLAQQHVEESIYNLG